MARLDRPDDVLFPVEELAVFAMPRAGHGEGRIPIHGRKAIVNTDTGKVLGVVGRDYLRRPEDSAPKGREAEVEEKLEAHLRALEKRYRDELGHNAYAAFNAITDFASHPPASPLVRRDRHAMQRLAGSWLSRFSRQCGEVGFGVGRYLEGYGP